MGEIAGPVPLRGHVSTTILGGIIASLLFRVTESGAVEHMKRHLLKWLKSPNLRGKVEGKKSRCMS
ncbi:hypothetical protein ACTXT7_003267 [Hymenolepis weldensis]